MRILVLASLLLLLVAPGCDRAVGTDAPPNGWANTAPTVVARVVERDAHQLLEVQQGALLAWVKVPRVGAVVGDHVLLGQGSPRYNVAIPEIGETVELVVDISRVRVVDEDTARRTVAAAVPEAAVPISQVYAEIAARVDQPIVVHGTVVKATGAVGAIWVHLQDGTGDAASGTNDITVKTQAEVVPGQRVAFRGVLRRDVDLGFGYHYEALVEDGVLLP
ncbi:MAG: hypothetical protein VX265_15295 [Myxococcota bacterium]|nr:hypothetical protein [Myxococcota bacterium]MEC8423443.1 hypothetical protein [Myxococcota bacterium]